MSRHERTLTVNPDRLKPEWGERKRWVMCGSAGGADVGRRGDTRSRVWGGTRGMFVSRMTSSVIRDGEVALESLCAPVSLRVHILLLLLTDHNRHVPITGPKSLGEKSVEYWEVNCKAIESDGHTPRFSCPPTLFVLSPRAPNSRRSPSSTLPLVITSFDTRAPFDTTRPYRQDLIVKPARNAFFSRVWQWCQENSKLTVSRPSCGCR